MHTDPAARRPRRAVGTAMLRAMTGLAAGVAMHAAMPVASAQEYELVLPDQSYAPQLGVSVHARIDVLYTPPGADTPVLIQRSFETGSASVNVSSQYVFEVLNEAVLAGVDQALAGGAQTGRISVVAVCYSFGVDGEGVRSLAPMGVFINTTDLSMTADGNAALRSNLRVIPPAGR